MDIKVSIVIPSYNSIKTISGCLESCINQTLSDIEIIVVNDGSTDESPFKIRHYQKSDPRIKLINKQNEGHTIARNTGVEAAKGKYLFFLDADDTIPKNAIGALFNNCVSDELDIVAGNVLIYKNDQLDKKRMYSNFGRGTGKEFLEYILENKLHYLWGKLIKKDLYTNNNLNFFKDAVVGEDQITMYQLCMYATRVETIDIVSYHYILNTDSITQKKTDQIIFTKRWEVYGLAIHELKQKYNYSPLVKQQLNLRILWALFGAIAASKKFIYNKKGSTKALYKTAFNATFTKPTLFYKEYQLILKSLSYPIIYRLFSIFKIKSS